MSAEQTFIEQDQKNADVDDRPDGCQHECVVGYGTRWVEVLLRVQSERGQKNDERDADGGGDLNVPCV